MDETSVAFAYPGQKGNVAQQQHTGRPQPASYTEKAILSIRRGNVTYCAFIASDMAVQSLLPQIVIGNKKKFTRKLLRTAWAEQPDFVQTWTAETGWINQTMMKQINSVLHNCLKGLTDEYQIIFIVDAARCHIHKDIEQNEQMNKRTTEGTPTVQPADRPKRPTDQPSDGSNERPAGRPTYRPTGRPIG